VILIDTGSSGDCEFGVKLSWEAVSPAKVGFDMNSLIPGVFYDKSMKLFKVSSYCGTVFCGLAWLREWDVVY